MIYERIKALRVDKDLSQKELADILNVTRSAYSNYENGNREVPLTLLIQLSRFYKVNLEYLLGLTDVPTPLPPSRRFQS